MIVNGNDVEREYAVLRSGLLGFNDKPILEAIVGVTAATYGAFFGALSAITYDRQILVARVGTELDETPRNESFCAVAIQQPGEPLIVADAQKDSRFDRLALVTGFPHLRFYAGMPIVDRAGYALGALCIADSRPLEGTCDPTELMIKAREIERMLTP